MSNANDPTADPVPLTVTEARLINLLLLKYSEDLGNKGCNDFDISQHVADRSEWLPLIREIQQHSFPDDDPEDISDSPYAVADFRYATYFAGRVLESVGIPTGRMDREGSTYRLLEKGETVLATDEYYDDNKKQWVAPVGSIGDLAPDRAYTSHRLFRRRL